MRVNSAFTSFFTNRLVVDSGRVIVMLAIFFIASSFTKHPDPGLRATQVNLIIRQIGHQLLLQAGDSTSRVLPVTESKEGTFLLRFENEFSFNHNSLLVLAQGLLPKTQFPSGYTVTAHDCMTAGIVYGFQLSNSFPDLLPCKGRSEPLGCYTIEFAFPDFYENGEPNKADIAQLTDEPESVNVYQEARPELEGFKTTTSDCDVDPLSEEPKSVAVNQETSPERKEFKSTTSDDDVDQPTEEPKSVTVDQDARPKREEFKTTTADYDIDQPTEEPKSVIVDQEARPKREEFKTTTFDYPLTNLVFCGIVVLGVTLLLIGRFRKTLTPVTTQNLAVPVQNQNHAIIKASVPELGTLGKFLFDGKGQRLLLGSEVISLTGKECKILELFNKNFGELIPRETLMQEVWINEGVITGRSLDMFVSKLRKKLSRDPELRITNVHGKGYKLEMPGI